MIKHCFHEKYVTYLILAIVIENYFRVLCVITKYINLHSPDSWRESEHAGPDHGAPQEPLPGGRRRPRQDQHPLPRVPPHAGRHHRVHG